MRRYFSSEALENCSALFTTCALGFRPADHLLVPAFHLGTQLYFHAPELARALGHEHPVGIMQANDGGGRNDHALHQLARAEHRRDVHAGFEDAVGIRLLDTHLGRARGRIKHLADVDHFAGKLIVTVALDA